MRVVRAWLLRLVAPYDSDPRTWFDAEWVDHHSGDAFVIATGWPPSTDVVHVNTYGDVVARYSTHPEPRSLGPNGMACNRQTIGLLRRRPVEANTISIIGKESNRIEEARAGLVHELSDLLAHYADSERDPWQTHVLSALRTMSRKQLVEATGLAPSTITRLRGGRVIPHRTHQRALTAIAVTHAHEALRRWDIAAPHGALAAVRLYLDEHARRSENRCCAECGQPLDNPRARHCPGWACKKRAARKREASARLAREAAAETSAPHPDP